MLQADLRAHAVLVAKAEQVAGSQASHRGHAALGAGQRHAPVERGDRRVVPRRDLARVDLGQHRAVELERLLDPRKVVVDVQRGHRQRDVE